MSLGTIILRMCVVDYVLWKPSAAISKQCFSFHIIVCCHAIFNSESRTLFAFKSSVDSKCSWSKVSFVPGTAEFPVDCLMTKSSSKNRDKFLDISGYVYDLPDDSVADFMV